MVQEYPMTLVQSEKRPLEEREEVPRKVLPTVQEYRKPDETVEPEDLV